MSCVPLMPAGSLKQDLPCQGERAGIQSHQPLGFLILMGSTKCSRPKGPRGTRTDGLPTPGLQPTLVLSQAPAILAAGTGRPGWGTAGGAGGRGKVSGHLPPLYSCLSATGAIMGREAGWATQEPKPSPHFPGPQLLPWTLECWLCAQKHTCPSANFTPFVLGRLP